MAIYNISKAKFAGGPYASGLPMAVALCVLPAMGIRRMYSFFGVGTGEESFGKNQIVYECTVLGKVSAKCLVQIIWNQVYTRKQLKRGRIGSEWGVGKLCFFFPDDSCR